jgi:pyrimidine operon attenuation protein / uracil phosphoribosyltransferase
LDYSLSFLGIFFLGKRGGIMLTKAIVMTDKDIERAIIRISHEIIEKNKGTDNLVLIGIQRRGVTLAKRISDHLSELGGSKIETGVLDITFYRDDLSLLSEHPIVNGTYIYFDITGKTVILVDDVLFTGRTVRAAIDALIDLGRPAMIQLAVLVDRGHRELPIRPDYVGKNIPTSRNEVIKVHVDEFDNENSVHIQDMAER